MKQGIDVKDAKEQTDWHIYVWEDGRWSLHDVISI